MKAVLISIVLAFGAGGGALAADRSYEFSGFDQVTVSAGITATITEGADFAVRATARSGSIRRLVIRQSGDTLEITRRAPLGLIGLFRRDRFEVQVSLPKLESVESSSGAHVKIAGAGEGDLVLSASSGSSLEFGTRRIGDIDVQASSGATLRAQGLSADRLDAQASSGASLTLDGRCLAIDAIATSGASLSAGKLECARADAEGSSGASLSVYASDAVDARASSGASIVVSGAPADREFVRSSGGSVTFE